MTTPSTLPVRELSSACRWPLLVVTLFVGVAPFLGCSLEAVPPTTPRAQRLGLTSPPKLLPLKPRESVPARGFLLDAISVTPLGPKRYLVEAWPDGELDATSHRLNWTLPKGATLLEGNKSEDHRLVLEATSLDGLSASLLRSDRQVAELQPTLSAPAAQPFPRVGVPIRLPSPADSCLDLDFPWQSGTWVFSCRPTPDDEGADPAVDLRTSVLSLHSKRVVRPNDLSRSRSQDPSSTPFVASTTLPGSGLRAGLLEVLPRRIAIWDRGETRTTRTSRQERPMLHAGSPSSFALARPDRIEIAEFESPMRVQLPARPLAEQGALAISEEWLSWLEADSSGERRLLLRHLRSGRQSELARGEGLAGVHLSGDFLMWSNGSTFRGLSLQSARSWILDLRRDRSVRITRFDDWVLVRAQGAPDGRLVAIHLPSGATVDAPLDGLPQGWLLREARGAGAGRITIRASQGLDSALFVYPLLERHLTPPSAPRSGFVSTPKTIVVDPGPGHVIAEGLVRGEPPLFLLQRQSGLHSSVAQRQMELSWPRDPATGTLGTIRLTLQEDPS